MKVYTNPNWNLVADDGKRNGTSFELDVDEFAKITAHGLGDCDAIYVVETTMDLNKGLECAPAIRGLAHDGCDQFIIRKNNKTVEIVGPGIYRVQRVVEDDVIQAQYAYVTVSKYKAKSVSRLQSRGFNCEC